MRSKVRLITAARSSPATGSGTAMGAVEPIRMASMRGTSVNAAATATGGSSVSKVTSAYVAASGSMSMELTRSIYSARDSPSGPS